MATKLQMAGTTGVARVGFIADQAFFTRYAIIMAGFIIGCFAQFSLRGFVDIRVMPPVVHAHAALMLIWLGLFVAQNVLAGRGELALHRTLGWVSAAVVAAVAVFGWAVGLTALKLHMVPPFFTPPYFLSLTTIEAAAFAATVSWAVSLRSRTEWHRRVMFGSTFLLLEPALGRLLPMPLLGAYGEWVALGCQLLFVAILARHDRKVLGKTHPATLAVASILVLVHCLVPAVAMLPPVAALAATLSGG